ncbi:MAG TPA: PqqD family protein [Thermodesulfovibrionales bacterium]|nr:PqqD family protein [Thermodesulfovibrionales bacterium]
MEAKDCLGNYSWDMVFVRDNDIVSRKISGELFLVPIKGKLADMERIFTLTAVAEYIWDRLDGQKSLHEVREDVIAHFDVAQEQADADIREFIGELEEAGLIRERTI